MVNDPAACPLCLNASRQKYRVRDIPIHDCLSCAHRFAVLNLNEKHVEQTYSDDYFEGGGAGYSDYTSEERLITAAGQRYERWLRRFHPPGSLLDIGAAAGFTLQAFQQQGWSVQGVEPNRKMADLASARLGIFISSVPIEHYQPTCRFEAITMIQVIAHVRDPRAVLQQCAEWLKPGGIMLMETWNCTSRMARLLGSSWHEYSPPSVLHWFSPQSLARLGRECGLFPVHRGIPRKMIDAGHALSLLTYKYEQTLLKPLLGVARKMLPSTLLLPYPSEDLFWMMLRKPNHAG